jgi:hypothetical protein
MYILKHAGTFMPALEQAIELEQLAVHMLFSHVVDFTGTYE